MRLIHATSAWSRCLIAFPQESHGGELKLIFLTRLLAELSLTTPHDHKEPSSESSHTAKAKHYEPLAELSPQSRIRSTTKALTPPQSYSHCSGFSVTVTCPFAPPLATLPLQWSSFEQKWQLETCSGDYLIVTVKGGPLDHSISPRLSHTSISYNFCWSSNLPELVLQYHFSPRRLSSNQSHSPGIESSAIHAC